MSDIQITSFHAPVLKVGFMAIAVDIFTYTALDTSQTMAVAKLYDIVTPDCIHTKCSGPPKISALPLSSKVLCIGSNAIGDGITVVWNDATGFAVSGKGKTWHSGRYSEAIYPPFTPPNNGDYVSCASMMERFTPVDGHCSGINLTHIIIIGLLLFLLYLIFTQRK